jgi:hypothetical protein
MDVAIAPTAPGSDQLSEHGRTVPLPARRRAKAGLADGVLEPSAEIADHVAAVYCGISPIRLLFIAGIIGGIATPIGLGLLLVVAGNHTLMRGRPVRLPLLVAGWIVTTLIAALSVAFIAQQLTGGS